LTICQNQINFCGKFISIETYMAKGKSTYTTWYCAECNAPKKTTAYNKRNNDNITKELSMFCKQCHKHVMHKRKDTKKG